jgi:hypothetical protein
MLQEADHPVFIGVFMVFQRVRESQRCRFSRPVLSATQTPLRKDDGWE